jgi:hypothetical protein
MREIGEVAFESGQAAKRTNDWISGALEFRGKAKAAFRERPSIMLIWNPILTRQFKHPSPYET